MKVEDVMIKDIITITVPGLRREALNLMVKHNKTSLPAVNKNGKFLGTISRKDIFEKPTEKQLAVLMKWDVPVTSPKESIEKAAEKILEQNVHRLPVIEKEKLIGIVTPTDLLQYIEDKKISSPVEDYVRSPCVPIFEDTPLEVASAIISLSKVYALPVLNKHAQLVGIVTDRDLFALSHINKKVMQTELGFGSDEDVWNWEGFRNIIKLYYDEADPSAGPARKEDHDEKAYVHI